METLEQLAQIDNEQDLKKFITEKNKVVAAFYATWCPFCVRFLPVFKKYAQHHEDVFLLAEDNEEIMCDTYEIDVFPTVIYFKDGQVAKRLDGSLGVGLEENQLDKFLKGIDI